MTMEVFVLTLKFPSVPHDDEEEPWFRTIEAREDTDLMKLHRTIQKIIDFEDDHLWEFYVGKNPRKRLYTVPKRTRLNEIYPLTGCKLYYLFDFGDHWLFEIKKSRKKMMEHPDVKYPRLIEAVGENPEQYPCDEEVDE